VTGNHQSGRDSSGGPSSSKVWISSARVYFDRPLSNAGEIAADRDYAYVGDAVFQFEHRERQRRQILQLRLLLGGVIQSF
jgi:hypothetical protein